MSVLTVTGSDIKSHVVAKFQIGSILTWPVYWYKHWQKLCQGWRFWPCS